MSDPDYFKYLTKLPEIAEHDAVFLRERDASYGGSWKRGGGRSAWFMLRRKMDRLLEMMRPPEPPPGWPTAVKADPETVSQLLAMTRAEDVFAQIQTRPGGEDGTVLAEVRDLRRYLLLVEAEMVARGVVSVGSDGGRSRPGTPEDGGHHARYTEPEPGITLKGLT